MEMIFFFFSILVVSAKKRYSSFLKKLFVFQKICFKVKVLIPISETEGYFENPKKRFLEEPILFLLALK